MHYRAPRRRKTEKGAEILFDEIMVESFPNMVKETDLKIQESKRVPKKVNLKRSTPGHIN